MASIMSMVTTTTASIVCLVTTTTTTSFLQAPNVVLYLFFNLLFFLNHPMANPEPNAFEAIKQHLLPGLDEQKKKHLLLNILNEFNGFKVLVFTNTKLKASQLAQFVHEKRGETVGCLHGDVPKARRTRVFRDFNANRLMIMFVTNVSTGELDPNATNIVINYDFPYPDIEAYVHRIEHCGRANKKGVSFSFINNELLENRHLHMRLLKIVKSCNESVISPELDLSYNDF